MTELKATVLKLLQSFVNGEPFEVMDAIIEDIKIIVSDYTEVEKYKLSNLIDPHIGDIETSHDGRRVLLFYAWVRLIHASDIEDISQC